MSVAIGQERLPSLEILGREWAYDIYSPEKAEKYIKLVKVLKKTKDSTLIRDIKTAISDIFVEGVELVQEISKYYGENQFLWCDALVQIINEIKSPKIKALQEEITQLKG